MTGWNVIHLVWTHPGNRGKRFRALTRSIAWQLQKRTLGRTWDLEIPGGLKIRCYPDSHGAGLMIYTNGAIDYDDNDFVRSYLRPGDAFLDIGANLGEYTLLAAQCVGPEGLVVAYEPGHTAFERLSENVSLNGLANTRLHRTALAGSSGQVRFLQSQDLTNRLVLGDTEEVTAEMVPATTMDEAVDGTNFTMGKIDVEGAEPLIFAGGTKALREANPGVWLVELKDPLLRRYQSSAAEFSRFLRDHGFQLGYYEIQSGLQFNEQPWIGRENVVAVHSSAHDQVLERLSSVRSD